MVKDTNIPLNFSDCRFKALLTALKSYFCPTNYVTMKSFLGILALTMLLTSCDDGDLTFEEISFDDANVLRCGTKLYKLNENEALILNLGESDSEFDSFFIENPTGTGGPEPIDITTSGAEIIVAYRSFNGTVDDESVCDPIPPINPAPTESWTAASGLMEITTTANIVENTTAGFEGGQRITGYRHNISFNNLEFNRSSGTTQLYPEFNFGTFDKPITFALPIVFDDELEQCGTSNIVYNIAGAHAMVLQVDPSLIDGSTLNVPQTGTVSTGTNPFTYQIFSLGTTLEGATHFCTGTPEANPVQVWTGTGEIEVTSTQVGTSLQHTIILRNITLTRGNSQFILAAEYNFGVLITE